MANSPIKFLDPYEKKDFEVYFGRDNDTIDAYNKVKSQKLTVIYGLSGTGKTSLIQCGIAHQFKDNWIDLLIRWSPESSLVKTTFDEIRDVAKNMIRWDGESPIDETIGALQGLYTDYYKPVCLIYDQFEELYISGQEEEKQQFIEFIKAFITEERLNAKIVIAIREEYLANMEDFGGIIPDILNVGKRVARMSKTQMADVIISIIEKSSRKFEGDAENQNRLAQSMVKNIEVVEDGNKKTIDLPYLQVYLDRFLKKNAEPVITENMIKEMGTFDDVLSYFLDETVTGIASDQDVNVTEDEVWDVLKMLITADKTKRGVALPDILKAIPSQANFQNDHE